MKIKPIDSRLYGILVLYEMHTGFLMSALEGIDEKDAQKRLDTQANHIAWITGSIVSGRYELAKLLGVELNSSTGTLFENNRGIISDATYPTLEEFKKDWQRISPILQEAITNASEEKLNEIVEMPGMKFTLFQFISFGSYRDANCIGQIALWRRLLGYQGMNYM